MVATLGYWNLRGLAQPIKLLLEYTGTEYKDKTYTIGQGPDYDRSGWLNDKFNLGLDFPNLPYYFDGNIKVTQSNAIMRYIAAKNNLAGKTEEEKVQVAMLECEAFDMRIAFARLCYDPDFEKLKGTFLSETLPSKLKQLSAFLGDRKWFVGNDVTYVDFFIYEVLDVNCALSSTCLDSFENLKNFKSNIESLPAIRKFMESSRFIKNEINAPMALFGGK